MSHPGVSVLTGSHIGIYEIQALIGAGGMGEAHRGVIRVKHGLRTLDALQAASCLQLESTHVFITSDAAFKKVSGLNVRILS